MEFITRPIERRLWPRGPRSSAPTPHWLVVARFAYALIRDFIARRPDAARHEPRLHDDARDRAAARVRVLRVEMAWASTAISSRSCGASSHRSARAPASSRAKSSASSTTSTARRSRASASRCFCYSALSMAQKVESSFNFVWRVDRPRSFARRFSEYLSFMLVGPLIMSVAMGFTATLASTTAMTRLREIGLIGRDTRRSELVHALRPDHRELHVLVRDRAEHARPLQTRADRRRVRRRVSGPAAAACSRASSCP